MLLGTEFTWMQHGDWGLAWHAETFQHFDRRQPDALTSCPLKQFDSTQTSGHQAAVNICMLVSVRLRLWHS